MSDASRPVGDASHRDSEAVASEPESTPKTSAPSRFERMCAFVRARYMQIDPRSAGIFRIALGVLLTADTLRHSKEAYDLYSNRGVLSNEFHLWRPSSGYQVTVFHAFSTPEEVKVLFALGIVCHLLLLIGYRPRLFAFLSFLFVTGMDQRIPLVENGGYVVVNLAAFWAIFLPTGQRFGLDAWVKSWRARREVDVTTLNDRSDFAGERKPMVSLLGLIILVNLSLVYFWNVVNKAGWIWRTGNTVHYVLYIKRMVTILGVWSRFIPEPLLRFTDWAVISCEATICVMIMSPAARRYTRPLAMVMMLLLHGTFGAMMRLGPFSWFLIGCSTLLLSPYQFADIRAWYVKRAPLLDVALSESASPSFPLSLTLGRALSRLDGYQRLRFVEGDSDALLSVRDRESDGAFESDPQKALQRIAHALPLGRFVYPLLTIATLGAPRRLLVWASLHSQGIARFFGLAAYPTDSTSEDVAANRAAKAPRNMSSITSGPPRPSLRFRKNYAIVTLVLVTLLGVVKAIPDNWGRGHLAPWGDRFADGIAALHKVVVTPDADRTVTSTSWMLLALMAAVLVVFWPQRQPRPLLLRDRQAARAARARELFLTYYALVSMSQSWNENKGIPPEIKFAQPAFIQMTINYPRLFQGWGMFAPNPIQEDGILVVDGYTIDGRRIDPYNGGGAPIMDLVSAEGDLGISQLRQDYGNRIRLEQNSLYRDELKGYLMRWHEETGNPNDELVAFDVYWVRDRCPALGSKTPTENDPVALISYRKPGYKRPSELSPIPPQPKIRNAEVWESTLPSALLPTLKR